MTVLLHPSRKPLNSMFNFVPQQHAWVIERMGKFHKILQPGFAILIPVIDKVRYVKILKEVAVEIQPQACITMDNVTLSINGVLFIKIVDPYKASYNVENAEYAISQLAMTSMRSEIGMLSLDAVLRSRQTLNVRISTAINEATEPWGITCLRYEIRDITPPQEVLMSMQRLVSADRKKRADILESEGKKASAINYAEGQKRSRILASEAEMAEKINKAKGQSEAIVLEAEAESTALAVKSAADAKATVVGATGEGDALRIAGQAKAASLSYVSAVMNGGPASQQAAALEVAEKYVEAFRELAKKGTSVVVPGNVGDMGGLISQGMAIYGGLVNAKQ